MIVLTAPAGSPGELLELLSTGQGTQFVLLRELAEPTPQVRSAIGLDGSGTVELELLPAGHPPGIYLLVRVMVRRSAATGGVVLQTLSYSAPLVGPVLAALPAELLLAAPGPMVLAAVPFYSTGQTAVVLRSQIFVSPVDPLLLDVYAAARS